METNHLNSHSDNTATHSSMRFCMLNVHVKDVLFALNLKTIKCA